MMMILFIIAVLALVFIAMQTRAQGTPAIRPGFLYAFGATLLVGVILLSAFLPVTPESPASAGLFHFRAQPPAAQPAHP